MGLLLIKNPDVARRGKIVIAFVVLAALWVVIGLWGYRQERMMVNLVDEATAPSQPEHWAEMPRKLVSDSDAPRWGMDFSQSLLPLDHIMHGGPGKDGVPALTQPHYNPAAQADLLDLDTDVIGVTLDGQSRAWPISILEYHEIINDSLAGHPLVVTYNPLSGAAMVFSGVIDGSVCTFGNSGLFYHSSPLIYDRQPTPYAESLWSPLMMRAVCGPAFVRGLQLDLIDADLMSWTSWLRLHPKTSVVSTQTGFSRSYYQPSEPRYLENDYLMMPAGKRSGRRPDLKNKDVVLILQIGQALKAYPLADFKAQENGRISDEVEGHRLTLVWDEASGRVSVQAEGEPNIPLARGYCYWFAWDAYHPDGAVYSGQGQEDGISSGSGQLRR